jgi:regulator of sirC expression with transglutaminase-like and TPR domain
VNQAAEDEALAQFRRLIERAPPPLLDCAAHVPLYADPHCEPHRVVCTVRQWGEKLAARVPADSSPQHRLRLLNHFFFAELAFRANEAEYYEAANSHLHRVIERRTGIPISLSLVYMELGRAAGLKLHGLGFPGHFLVKLLTHDGALVIDVFAGGQALSAEALRARLAALAHGGEVLPLEIHLRVASERDILARLLRNLKAIHLRSGQTAAALQVQQRLVALRPDDADERRDRGLLFAQLECPRAAAEDFLAYLSMHPAPPDARRIRERLDQMQRAARRLN